MNVKKHVMMIASLIVIAMSISVQAMSFKKEYLDEMLFDAAKRNDVERMKFWLAQKNVDVNYQDKAGATALMEAAEYNSKDVAQLLIDKGADLNLKDNRSYTALMLAALEGAHDIVRLLIDKEADLNLKNVYGNTALIIAAHVGDEDVVQWLINAGAHLHLKNNKGQTAYDRAVEKKKPEIIQMLKEAQKFEIARKGSRFVDVQKRMQQIGTSDMGFRFE